MAIPKIPYMSAAALLLAALKWIVAGPAEGKILDQPPDAGLNRLYLPSPIEAELLSSGPTVWPKLFSKERPPVPERMPELYTAVAREARFGRVSSKEFEKARLWSVLLNSLHLDDLKDRLKEETTTETISRLRTSRGCPLFDRETLYRRAQVQPELKPALVKYMRDCKDKSVLRDWTELELATKNKERRDQIHLVNKLRLRSFLPDQSWAMWFSGELVRVNKLTEAAASGPSEPEQNTPQSGP